MLLWRSNLLQYYFFLSGKSQQNSFCSVSLSKSKGGFFTPALLLVVDLNLCDGDKFVDVVLTVDLDKLG